MKKISLVWFFPVIFCLVSFGCKDEKTTKNQQKKNYQRIEYKKRSSPNFELINQDISSGYRVAGKFKTIRSLTQYIWLKADFSNKELKSFLKQQYNWVNSQRIFKDGKSPESIFITVYDTKKKAEKGYSNWLASLDGNDSGYFNIVVQTNKKSEIAEIELPDYEIVSDRTVDMYKVKVMVNQDIWVKNDINRKSLRKLLNKQYSKISRRTGYKYFEHPTQILIYVYDSRKKALESSYNWVAMAMTKVDGGGKEILFSDKVK